MDICNHLIAQNKWRIPEDYADTFKVLEEARVLDKKFSETLIKMVRFRNRLAHLYWEVDNAMVYDLLLACKSDIEKFLKDLNLLLKKEVV